MKKLALALAAVAVFGFAAPSFVSQASAATEKVVIKRGHGGGHMQRTVVRRDRGMHRGWAHSRPHGMTKKVIIKRGNGRTVKKVIHRG
jgi:hypothetical protein